MSFLDDLLTLDAPLEEGQQLVTFPRTWRNNLPWNAQPFCYKAHQTKAGLYVVLRHDADGRVTKRNLEGKFNITTPLVYGHLRTFPHTFYF